jgi:hypothetical protein
LETRVVGQISIVVFEKLGKREVKPVARSE